MSDWAENDDEVQPVPRFVGRRRFEDEDKEEEPEDWDAEEEEKPKPAPVKPAPKPVTKPGKAKKNFLKGAEVNRRGVAGEETGLEDWDGPLSEAERKRLQREAEMQSDLDNAAALFGGAKLDQDDEKQEVSKVAETASSGLAASQPATKEQWEKYADQVYDTFIRPQSSRAGFDKQFFPHFLKLLTSNGLRDVDLRKGSTKMREYAEAKGKAEQELKRTGGNRPAAAAKAKPKQVGTASAKNTYVTMN
ncbi:Translation initiation factor 3 subunit J component [Malassezia psittaci]|uniref:Eukaryotic translation initiation factor 3 30 kDa subunit n=1 Tax=Malassezia psittaci TaxID=1821823 RepID=A0AAF0F5P6_9BASI|nr:Translation initiation factor 3 subunit J component [Malassezia psittaci]